MGETTTETIGPEIFSAAQLILAEKRTSLASVRTGMGVLALPLSVLGLLVTTSKYYDPVRVLPFLLPLLALCSALVVLGAFLIIRAIRQIHEHDRLIQLLKQEHRTLAQYIQ